MASNFPMVKTESGDYVTVISGAAIDASGHVVKFNEGMRQAILFLSKVDPEFFVNP